MQLPILYFAMGICIFISVVFLVLSITLSDLFFLSISGLLVILAFVVCLEIKDKKSDPFNL